MFTAVLIVHVCLAVVLVLTVLIQHGKGADAGIAFGSANSGSAFGASGANPFLYKFTVVIAILFFATSLTLAYLASAEVERSRLSDSVIEQVEQDQNTVPTTDEKPSDIPE